MSCATFPDFSLACGVAVDSCYLYEPVEEYYAPFMSTTTAASSSSTDLLPASHRPLHESSSQEAVNPYHVLQIRRDATPSEIREAYRRLALWHHPGRSINNCDTERNRRAQVFLILAACYETLMDNEVRGRYDDLLDNLPAGRIHVGGRRMVSVTSGTTKKQRGPRYACAGCFDPTLPSPTSRSTSNDTFQDVDSVVVPALANSSSSSSSDEDHIHYTADETNRLFGGPLSTMYKARNFESFTDPMVVFDKVFDTHVFSGPTHDEATRSSLVASSDPTSPQLPMRSPSRSAAWTGSSTTLKDGTIVSTTTRILFDRKMTRTETITVDPKTKKRHVKVTVTSEELEPERKSPPQSPGMCSCIACGGGSNQMIMEEELKQERKPGGVAQKPPILFVEENSESPTQMCSREFWMQVCDVVQCCGTIFPE